MAVTYTESDVSFKNKDGIRTWRSYTVTKRPDRGWNVSKNGVEGSWLRETLTDVRYLLAQLETERAAEYERTAPQRARDRVFGRLVEEHRAGTYRITKFQKAVTDSPHYALRWSEDAFEGAAMVYQVTSLLDGLHGDYTTLREIRQGLEHDLINAAKYPTRNSSAPQNLMSQHEQQARAKILELLRSHEEHEDGTVSDEAKAQWKPVEAKEEDLVGAMEQVARDAFGA